MKYLFDYRIYRGKPENLEQWWLQEVEEFGLNLPKKINKIVDMDVKYDEMKTIKKLVKDTTKDKVLAYGFLGEKDEKSPKAKTLLLNRNSLMDMLAAKMKENMDKLREMHGDYIECIQCGSIINKKFVEDNQIFCPVCGDVLLEKRIKVMRENTLKEIMKIDEEYKNTEKYIKVKGRCYVIGGWHRG